MKSTTADSQQFWHGSTNARFQALDSQTGQWTLYAAVGGTVLSEYVELTPNSPTWTKSYTYLGDSQLSTITPNGPNAENIEFNHPDRLGTKLVTNQQTGTATEQATLPFGRPLDAESSLQNNNKRFTSYDRSPITKLDYAVNRTYDSKLGRFTQVDPAGMRAVNPVAPQTLNMYVYCANDPINRTDPDGLGIWGFFKKLFKWIVVAIAVVVAVLTVIYAPGLLTGVLKPLFAIIGALANAASSVLNAFGLTKAAAIFGIVAAVASFGSSLLEGFANKLESFFGYFKLATGVGSNVATLAGADRVGAWISVVGIAGNVYEMYKAVKSDLELAFEKIRSGMEKGLTKLGNRLIRMGRRWARIGRQLVRAAPRIGVIAARTLSFLPPFGEAVSAVVEVLPKNDMEANREVASSGAIANYLQQQAREKDTASQGINAWFGSLTLQSAR